MLSHSFNSLPTPSNQGGSPTPLFSFFVVGEEGGLPFYSPVSPFLREYMPPVSMDDPGKCVDLWMSP